MHSSGSKNVLLKQNFIMMKTVEKCVTIPEYHVTKNVAFTV